jgi:hypothetical protein
MNILKIPPRFTGTVFALYGLYAYYTRGKVSRQAWYGLLNAHCRTNGRFTERLRPILHRLRPPRPPATVSGALGEFSVAEQKRIAQAIAKDGFYVFERLLAPEICNQIEQFAAATPGQPDGRPSDPREFVRFDPNHPIARTYKIAKEDIVTNHGMQRLMADPVFLGIAETYLDMLPAIGGVDLWWSAAYGNGPGDDAAQSFHFDFDAPPVWLKLFVYLKDVGPENGPHVFVRGSHIANYPAAASLRARGYQRISDEEITAAFGSDTIAEIEGKRGTVFFADTRGFHKGRMLNAGSRLVGQLIYCHPAFDDHSERHSFPPDLDPSLAVALAKMPEVFERYR